MSANRWRPGRPPQAEGLPHMKKRIRVTVDGTSVLVPAGTSVTAAVVRSGRAVFRRSVTGEPRGPVCGMGICYECRVTVNGRANQRSCLLPCEAGMEIRTDG